MTAQVTLSLSDVVIKNARSVAQRTHRPLEFVLSDWLDLAAAELPASDLSDHDLIALCEWQLPPAEQAELSALLADNREGRLDIARRMRFDGLMNQYDRALLRKSQALREAVERRLRDPLQT